MALHVNPLPAYNRNDKLTSAKHYVTGDNANFKCSFGRATSMFVTHNFAGFQLNGVSSAWRSARAFFHRKEKPTRQQLCPAAAADMADRASEGSRCTARGVQAFRGENSIYDTGTVFSTECCYHTHCPAPKAFSTGDASSAHDHHHHSTSLQCRQTPPPPALITKGPRVSLAMQPVCGQKQPLVSSLRAP